MADSYGDLKIVRFEVTGMEGAGLLMHNPAGMSQRKEGGIGPKVIPTPEVEAEAGCYRMPSGQLYLPTTHFRAAILLAAAGQKIEKKSAKLILSAGLFAVEEYAPLIDPKTGNPLRDYEIDIRRAVVQKQGISRARPKVPNWQALVAFQYEPMLVNPGIIMKVFDLAGAIIGVGDFRVARGGPFGRFSVELIPAN
jgi:hypothetical protein